MERWAGIRVTGIRRSHALSAPLSDSEMRRRASRRGDGLISHTGRLEERQLAHMDRADNILVALAMTVH